MLVKVERTEGESHMLRRGARPPRFEYLGDIVRSLGNISPKRIRFHPLPGKATIRDLVCILDNQDRLFELVDGTLVEKPVGAPESRLTIKLAAKIDAYVEDNDLGYTLGPDGAIRMFARLVRLPDISFISWERRP